MIIKKLTLTNLGVFRGQQELDLTPLLRYGLRRPIILIGGKNGSGKTTILEAIRLCLYGQSAIDKRNSTKEYHKYLSSLIHRSPQLLINPDSASVKLEFEYVRCGEKENFNVERAWQRRGSNLIEALTVYRNGVLLSELEAEYWQDFIKDMIPQGIVQLFFFDGELIQQIAYGDKDDTTLADSVKNLLGLGLIERLQSDLSIYIRRKQKAEKGVNEVQKQIADLEAEKAKLEGDIARLKQDLAQKTGQIDQLVSHVKLLEEKLSQQGGQWIQDRQKLNEQKVRLSEKIEILENQIREQCADLFPFALVPELCQQLHDQLQKEQEYQRWQVVNAEIANIAETIASELKSETFRKHFPKISQSTWEKLSKFIYQRLIDPQHYKPSSDFADFTIVHDLSRSTQAKLIGWINQTLTAVPQTMESLASDLEKSTRQLEEVEMKIQRIPPEESIKPTIEELSEANKKLGAMEHEVGNLEKEIASLNFKLEETKRALRRLYEKVDEIEDLEERVTLANNVQSALQEFMLELKHRKLSELESCFATIFNRLARKGDLIHSIKVKPEDFSATLYNKYWREIPKAQLSAGEKQIYAISMLWALGQVSGRPLPIIIDTPLARLDSDHRRHIVEKYFPKASHQVIILSTDTEIDQSCFQLLGPEISHAFHLEYDQGEGMTKVQEGYFWARRDGEN